MLHPQIRLIFETDDLSKVALSTISRCRIIYFDETVISPPVIANNVDKSVIEIASDLTATLSLPLSSLKLQYLRLRELYLLHEAFAPDDPQLASLLSAIATMSVLPAKTVDACFEIHKIIPQKLFASFPQAFGQWTDLSTEQEPERRFWRMFLKRLLRSSLMLMVYGKSGTGKTMFINELVADLDSEQ